MNIFGNSGIQRKWMKKKDVIVLSEVNFTDLLFMYNKVSQWSIRNKWKIWIINLHLLNLYLINFTHEIQFNDWYLINDIFYNNKHYFHSF